jgi:hypothetical protein
MENRAAQLATESRATQLAHEGGAA